MPDSVLREQTAELTGHQDKPPSGANTDEPRPVTEAKLDEPLPTTNDPGGAHGKGYSADPRPGVDVKDEGPVPLAPGPDTHPAFHQPEREGKVVPTGRGEPGGSGDPIVRKGSSENDRLKGDDR